MRESESAAQKTGENSAQTLPSNNPNSLPSYTATHYAKLCENEYGRYIPNSGLVAHALIRQNQVAQSNQAMQYQLPDDLYEQADVSMVGEITNIEKFSLSNNKTTLVGMVGDEIMLSRRSYEIHISTDDTDEEIYTFHPFSPKKVSKTQFDRSIEYDTSSVVRFNDTEEAREIIEQTPIKRKTSDELEINNSDVYKRTQIKRRKPDQNTVMGRHRINKITNRDHRKHKKAKSNHGANRVGLAQQHQDQPIKKTHSAVTEMAECLETYRNILTEEMQNKLSNSSSAPLTWGPKGLVRAEWLHRHSHNLHPVSIDPQHENNLGAAEKRYNTEMMILERTVQFFALNVPGSKSKIHGEFDMLLDTEVIDKIHFSAFIQFASVKIQLIQHIDAFQNEPQDVKASDLAGLVGIVHALIEDKAPKSVQPVAQKSLTGNIRPFRGNFFNRVEVLNDDDDSNDVDLTHQQRNTG